jgi:hypothetical protein
MHSISQSIDTSKDGESSRPTTVNTLQTPTNNTSNLSNTAAVANHNKLLDPERFDSLYSPGRRFSKGLPAYIDVMTDLPPTQEKPGSGEGPEYIYAGVQSHYSVQEAPIRIARRKREKYGDTDDGLPSLTWSRPRCEQGLAAALFAYYSHSLISTCSWHSSYHYSNQNFWLCVFVRHGRLIDAT